MAMEGSTCKLRRRKAESRHCDDTAFQDARGGKFNSQLAGKEGKSGFLEKRVKSDLAREAHGRPRRKSLESKFDISRGPPSRPHSHNFEASVICSGAIILGAVVRSDPIKLGFSSLSSYTGPVKGSVKAPSIIPSDASGQQKPWPLHAEPFSPHVTCLGKVKVRQKECKASVKNTGYERRDERNREVSVELTRTDESHGEAGIKDRWMREQQEVDENSAHRMVELNSDLSPCREMAMTSRERGAMLASCLLSMLQQQSWRLHEESTAYVPPVPPPNCLLLMRKIHLAHGHLKALTAGATVKKEYESRPLPDSSLWERRAITKPSELNIVRRIASTTIK